MPDPNVPDAFAVIADRQGSSVYTSNAQVVVYKLVGNFDPKEAITHGYVDSQKLLAWQSTNASMADFGGFPSSVIEGTYREGDMTLNTSRRHVIATSGPRQVPGVAVGDHRPCSGRRRRTRHRRHHQRLPGDRARGRPSGPHRRSRPGPGCCTSRPPGAGARYGSCRGTRPAPRFPRRYPPPLPPRYPPPRLRRSPLRLLPRFPRGAGGRADPASRAAGRAQPCPPRSPRPTCWPWCPGCRRCRTSAFLAALIRHRYKPCGAGRADRWPGSYCEAHADRGGGVHVCGGGFRRVRDLVALAQPDRRRHCSWRCAPWRRRSWRPR